jgi:uncharacterized cupredoxin-like copper-binding protein
VPHRRALPFAALLAGAALLASSCSLADLDGQNADRPAGDGRAAPATREPRAARRRPGPAWATGAPVRVVMNDRFRYRPAAIMVRAGRRVTFDVTNAGKLPHEFILGDRATQLDHERQMQGGPPAAGAHDHAHADHAHAGHATAGAGGALTVPPGQTRRLTWTFDEPGIVLYGCHVLGHWAAGMKGTIVVLSPDRPLPLPALAPLAG